MRPRPWLRPQTTRHPCPDSETTHRVWHAGILRGPCRAAWPLAFPVGGLTVCHFLQATGKDRREPEPPRHTAPRGNQWPWVLTCCRGSFLRTDQSPHSRSQTPSQKPSTPHTHRSSQAWGLASLQPQPSSSCRRRWDAPPVRGRAEGSRLGHGLALSATEGAVCQHPLSGTAPGPSSPSRHWEHTRALGNIASACVCIYLQHMCVCAHVCGGEGAFSERAPLSSLGDEAARSGHSPSRISVSARQPVASATCFAVPPAVTAGDFSGALLCMWMTCSLILLLTEVSRTVLFPILFGVLYRPFHTRRPTHSVPAGATKAQFLLVQGPFSEGGCLCSLSRSLNARSCPWLSERGS